jgi:hypothetical protein
MAPRRDAASSRRAERQRGAEQFRQALADRLAEGGLRLNLDKSGIVPFSKNAPKGTVAFLGFEFYWGRVQAGKVKKLKLKTQKKRLHRSIQTFKEWVKLSRNRMKLDKLWALARSKVQGHLSYFPPPPSGTSLRNVTSERATLQHKPKSRMRELRTSGSVRSAGRQRPAFT